MQRIRIGVLMVVASCTGVAQADDLFSPPWRGLPGSTYQQWTFDDADDLSYARTKSGRDMLIANGVNPQRIRLTACGSTEPLASQAYTERRRALNRRVEIIVTESVISDFQGRDAAFKER